MKACHGVRKVYHGVQWTSGLTGLGDPGTIYGTNKQTHKQLDRVGPVDNRPSTNKLHHFVRKRKEKKGEKNVTRDM